MLPGQQKIQIGQGTKRPFWGAVTSILQFARRAIARAKRLLDLRPQRPQSTALSSPYAGCPQLRPLHTVLRDSI